MGRRNHGAMKKYQDKNGITPTGKIDAVSLEKLGLGSVTAGKGVRFRLRLLRPLLRIRLRSSNDPPESNQNTLIWLTDDGRTFVVKQFSCQGRNRGYIRQVFPSRRFKSEKEFGCLPSQASAVLCVVCCSFLV